MLKTFFFTSLMLVAYCALGQQTLQYYYSQAREAQKSGDNARFYEMIVKASELHPYHQGIMYQRAIAAALTSRNEEATQYLKEAILIFSPFDLTIDEFKSLHGTKDFEALKTLQQELMQPVVHSDTAFVVKNRTLHLESVAAGKNTGEFYISSVHQRQVLKINKKGQITDFTKPAQDELTAVLGIKVDKAKNRLWLCSSPMPEMKNYDTLSRSSVLAYDLKTGKLLARYEPDAAIKESVFGDLLLNKKGEVFISDTRTNTVFKVNEATKKLDAYFTSSEFWNIQGIAFSEDEQYLFISDYIKGIFRLDTKTKELIPLNRGELNLSLKSVDGLLWYKNSLIAIQNGVSPMRASRYFLNADLSTITKMEIIDRAHPAFNEPTNGCIVGNELFYVATSQWGGYTEQHQQKPVDQLQDIVILKADLEKIR